MSTTYDGALGTTVTVRPVGSQVTVGFDTTIALVGPDGSGANEANADPIFLDSKADAEDAFGSGSPLVGAFVAARNNGAAEIYGVSVDNAASNPDYTAATQAAMDIVPRYVVAVTEDDTAISSITSVVKDYATDLDFARVFAPGEDTAVPDISSYTPGENHQRYIEVAPATCTVAGESTLTAAAVAGHAARKPLGASLALDDINVDSLGVDYRDSEADNFDNVTAVTKDGTVVDGVTTSDEGAFSDIFQMEIVDTVALGIDSIAQDYAGRDPNTEDGRENLASDTRVYLQSLVERRPPLLASADGGNAYAVQASLGSNDEQVDLDVGVEPLSVMKQINVGLDIGDVTTFTGLSV